MDLKGKSKGLSWLLRHGAIRSELDMNPAGWAAVQDVLRLTEMTRDELDQVVMENDKRRFQIVGNRVRATQGHSAEGTPVTADALEASWARVEGRTQPVFHGTRIEVVETAGREGLLPMGRTHVHLAAERSATFGKRANVALLLLIDPAALERAGIGLFESPNGVLLCREVPPQAIVGLEPLTKRARAEAEQLRASLLGSG